MSWSSAATEASSSICSGARSAAAITRANAPVIMLWTAGVRRKSPARHCFSYSPKAYADSTRAFTVSRPRNWTACKGSDTRRRRPKNAESAICSTSAVIAMSCLSHPRP